MTLSRESAATAATQTDLSPDVANAFIGTGGISASPQIAPTHARLLVWWRWWLPPTLLSLSLTLIFLHPFIGDWDGLDYTVLSVRGYPSSMMLGRSLFIFFNHALYLIAHKFFNVPADHAYVLFKYAVVAQSPLAVIACWTLARHLTHSVQSATIAALLVALSPVFILYSGQVMTDVPSILLLCLALIIHLQGVEKRSLWLILAGAAILGAGVNVRETVGFFAPWLLIAPFVMRWKAGGRELATIGASVAVFLLIAFAPFALWITLNTEYWWDWHGWLVSMRNEAALHPVSMRSTIPFFTYFFLTAPMVFVALPVAAWKEWCERGLSPTLALAGVGLFATLLLFFNYSTAIVWRYFLTGLPALAPIVADYFVREQTEKLKTAPRGFASAAAGVLFVAALMVFFIQPKSSDYFNKLSMAKDYHAQLELVPRDAVVIPGSQTVAVTYWRGIGAGEWEVIGIGSGWPSGSLAEKIKGYLGSGRRVFLDSDRRWWPPCGWTVREIRELATLQSQFHFRRVTRTIYEVRPENDPLATDNPDLQSLLPENRPDETRKCFNLGGS